MYSFFLAPIINIASNPLTAPEEPEELPSKKKVAASKPSKQSKQKGNIDPGFHKFGLEEPHHAQNPPLAGLIVCSQLPSDISEPDLEHYRFKPRSSKQVKSPNQSTGKILVSDYLLILSSQSEIATYRNTYS